VKALMPQLRASISPAIDLQIAVDRSTTIRTSLRDVERTLILAVLLVIVAGDAGAGRGGIGLPDRDIRRDVPVRLQPR
jgi:hypothetical protein